MEANERLKKQDELIERIGVHFEKEGLQPVAARILSLLMVSDKEEQTFDEIRETLKISKSAASNGINLLLKIGELEYITKLGDRKRYFKLVSRDVASEVESKLDLFTDLCGMLKETIQLKKDKNSDVCKSFNRTINFHQFFKKSFLKIVKDWEKTQKK